jgi:hypothetical protein
LVQAASDHGRESFGGKQIGQAQQSPFIKPFIKAAGIERFWTTLSPSANHQQSNGFSEVIAQDPENQKPTNSPPSTVPLQRSRPRCGIKDGVTELIRRLMAVSALYKPVILLS